MSTAFVLRPTDPATPAGAYDLYIVANGVPSAPVRILVGPSPAPEVELRLEDLPGDSALFVGERADAAVTRRHDAIEAEPSEVGRRIRAQRFAASAFSASARSSPFRFA